MLVIEEVLMLSDVFFDNLEFIARTVKRNDKPFGGIQPILCGDVYQLQPALKASL